MRASATTPIAIPDPTSTAPCRTTWRITRALESPSADRIAHLLLALREDELGFATVANHAFAGARWRVRRRLPRAMRPALDS